MNASLLCFLGLFLPPVQGEATLPSSPLPVQDDAFEKLNDEFDSAARDWRALYREARRAKDDAALAKLDEKNPVKAFFPRFETLARSGNAEAALWSATHVEEVEQGLEVIASRKAELYTQAVAGLAAGDEARSLLRALTKDDGVLSAPAYEKLLGEFAEKCGTPEVAAEAAFALAKSYANHADDDQGRARVLAQLEVIETKYPGTKYAKYATDQLYVHRNLTVGAKAPDFVTEDVDGVEFKLSDYRGKVVLMDFWGFW
jgi:hypothetical protein